MWAVKILLHLLWSLGHYHDYFIIYYKYYQTNDTHTPIRPVLIEYFGLMYILKIIFVFSQHISK